MDENLIDQALSELGLLEVGMTFREKKELLQAIEISKSTVNDQLQVEETQNLQYSPKLFEDQSPDKKIDEINIINSTLESTLEECQEDDEPITDQNQSVEIIPSDSFTQNKKDENLENKSDKLRKIKNENSKIGKNKNKNKFSATHLKGKYKSEESLRTCPKCEDKFSLVELVKHMKICQAIPTNFSSNISSMFNSSSSSSQTSSSNTDPDLKFSTFVPISQQMDSCIDYHNQFKYGEMTKRPRKIRKTRKKRRGRKR